MNAMQHVQSNIRPCLLTSPTFYASKAGGGSPTGCIPSFLSSDSMAECGAATLPGSSAMGDFIASGRSSDLPLSPSSDFASPLSLLLPLLVLRRSPLS